MSTKPLELEECRKCEATFNIAQQYYWDDLCPSCKEEEEAGSTHVECAVCHDDVPDEDVQYTTLVTSGHSERVPVCSDECELRAGEPPWKP